MNNNAAVWSATWSPDAGCVTGIEVYDDDVAALPI
jgi:hypothetical protein